MHMHSPTHTKTKVFATKDDKKLSKIQYSMKYELMLPQWPRQAVTEYVLRILTMWGA